MIANKLFAQIIFFLRSFLAKHSPEIKHILWEVINLIVELAFKYAKSFVDEQRTHESSSPQKNTRK